MPKNNLQILAVDQIFRSTEKSKKIWSTDYETFDQLKKDNFDQVKFGQTTPCPINGFKKSKITWTLIARFIIIFIRKVFKAFRQVKSSLCN